MTFNNSEELFDPGMHVTWLVHDIAAFQQHPGPTSIRDRSLKFGLSYKEWYAVYFDVLRVDKGEYKQWVEEHQTRLKTAYDRLSSMGRLRASRCYRASVATFTTQSSKRMRSSSYVENVYALSP